MPKALSPTLREGTGFTLIELLVVVGVIATLIALLLPAMGRALDFAQATHCSSNLRQLAQETLYYAADHDGVLPPTSSCPNGSTTSWWQCLYPDYTTDVRIFACPGDRTPFVPSNYSVKGRVLADGRISYGIPGLDGTQPETAGTGWKPAGLRLALFHQPANTCLFTEYRQATYTLQHPWFGNYPLSLSTDVAYPHGGKTRGNFAFLDGHIISMTKAQMLAAFNGGNGTVSFGYSPPR